MGHVLMINFPGRGTSILLLASQRSCKDEEKASYIMQLRNTLKKLKNRGGSPFIPGFQRGFITREGKRKEGLCRVGLQYVR